MDGRHNLQLDNKETLFYTEASSNTVEQHRLEEDDIQREHSVTEDDEQHHGDGGDGRHDDRAG